MRNITQERVARMGRGQDVMCRKQPASYRAGWAAPGALRSKLLSVGGRSRLKVTKRARQGGCNMAEARLRKGKGEDEQTAERAEDA